MHYRRSWSSKRKAFISACVLLLIYVVLRSSKGTNDTPAPWAPNGYKDDDSFLNHPNKDWKKMTALDSVKFLDDLKVVARLPSGNLDALRMMLKTKSQRYELYNLQPKGVLACLRSEDIVCRSIRESGKFEQNLRDTILRVLGEVKARFQKEVVFVDIGVNVGAMAVPVALGGYKVVGFEGMQSNFQLLQASQAANELSNEKFRIFNVALSEHPANCTFVSHKDNQGDGSLCCDKKCVVDMLSRGYEKRFDVDAVLLDDSVHEWVDRDVMYVMKIDVEGHEFSVLKGALRWFRSSLRPVIIVSEVSKWIDVTNYGDTLVDLGYACARVDQGWWFTSTKIVTMVTKADFALFHQMLISYKNMDNILCVARKWHSELDLRAFMRDL